MDYENKKKADAKTLTYQPTPEEAVAIGVIRDRWQKMKDARRSEETEWPLDEEQFLLNGTRQAIDDWKANLQLPDTTAAILAALSEMVDQTPNVTYMPRETGDVQRAKKLNAAWLYAWEKAQGNVELLDHLLQSAIYGTGVWKEYWKHEMVNDKEVTQWETDEDGHELPIPKNWTKRRRTTYDDAFGKSVALGNFWIDPAATSMENAIDCVEIEAMDEVTFHANFDHISKSAKIVKGGAITPEYTAHFPEATAEASNLVEVVYYWNKAEDCFYILANGVLVTKPGNPNPYNHKELPYARSPFIPRPRSFYGLGLARITRSLQAEKNTTRNMRLDATKLGINQILIVDDAVEFDDDKLRSEPNQVIKGPPGSVSFVAPPPVNPSAYKEEELLREDIIRATGVDPRLQTLGGKGDTATEIAILKESSIKRIRLTLRLLEWLLLNRIGRLRLANFQQFYKIEKFRDIIGKNGQITQEPEYPMIRMEEGEYEPMKPGDLKGEYDIIVAAGSTLPISKALETQKRISLYDRLKGHPDVNQRELVRDLIDAYDLDSTKLLTKPGEPPMGMSPTRGPEGVGPMPGNGTAGMGGPEQMQQSDVLPAQENGVNPNA